MIPINILSTFILASFILCIAPGPDNIFVLTQSALRGRSAGVAVTLGLSTGLIFHTTAVAFGVAAVVMASAVAFTVLKVVGACYLLYIAWQAFKAPVSDIQAEHIDQLTSFQLYRRGIIMNITNPKVSIFFIAFLPQFADPARGSVAVQMLLLGGVFMMLTVVVFSSVAIMAGTIGTWLKRSPKAQSVMNKATAFVLTGLALKLITSER